MIAFRRLPRISVLPSSGKWILLLDSWLKTKYSPGERIATSSTRL